MCRFADKGFEEHGSNAKPIPVGNRVIRIAVGAVRKCLSGVRLIGFVGCVRQCGRIRMLARLEKFKINRVNASLKPVDLVASCAERRKMKTSHKAVNKAKSRVFRSAVRIFVTSFSLLFYRF